MAHTPPRTPGEPPCNPEEMAAVYAPRNEEERFQRTAVGMKIMAAWQQTIEDYRRELDIWWTNEYRRRCCPTCGHARPADEVKE